MLKKSANIALFFAVLGSNIYGVCSAQIYTSEANGGEAWSQTWNPSGVVMATKDGDNNYVFQDGNTYIKNNVVNTLINNGSTAVKLSSSSNLGVTFQGFGLTGDSVTVGDNIVFQNTVDRTTIATTTGGVTIGNNVTVSNTSQTDIYNSGMDVVGAVYIGDGLGYLDGQSTFGENFTANSNSIVNHATWTSATGGAAISIAKGKMDVTFGDNAVFTNNTVRGVWYTSGGAISGISNQGATTSYNKITFNGAATFINNQAISENNMARGGAIAFSSGTQASFPPKESEVIFNSAGKTVTLIGNLAETQSTTQQAQGGAIGLGEGNLYIEAEHIIIKGNTAKGATALGGAIFTSKSTTTDFFPLDKYGKLTLVGNAEISGNQAIGTATAANSYGGALFANGNILLRPNGTSNSMVFVDNSAKYGNDIYLNGTNTILTFDYSNGGLIKIYDGFGVRTSDSGFVQTGNGITKLWSSNTSGGFSNIESGVLSLEAAVTQSNTIDGLPTTYAAGELSAKKINLGTDTTSAVLHIYHEATITSGLTTAGDYFNISDNNTINIYGSGAINLDASMTDGFNNFGSKREINIGSGNTVNLAARTAEQIAAGIYNKRGTNGASQFTALHFNSMGANNTFVLNSNIAINTADKLVVGSTAAGQNLIKIGYDPIVFAGGNVTETTKTLVVEASATADPLNLRGTFAGAVSDLGVHSWTPTIEKDGDNWYIVGGSKSGESTTVKTAKTMTRALMSSFRLINNDLLKRMGELRFNPNAAGVWLRTYTGKSDLKDGGGQRYVVVQGGMDRVKEEKKGRRFTGVAFEHLTSNNSFENGSGTTKMYDIGLYQVWQGNSGHYSDLVGKVYKTSNSMNIVDGNSVNVQGSYKGWAYGISYEYGYRKEMGKGYFLIPQAEFTYRHISSADYNTSNNIHVNHGAYNSLTGRAGITIGRKYNSQSQIYITANVMREFLANAQLSARDTFGGSFKESLSGKETWYNLAIGASIKKSKKNDWYVELERDFGSGSNTKWQILLGGRWSW